MAEPGVFRIGELSRRAGVSPELLRAWERRYGLLHPTRSPGGLRLYSSDDLARVRRMQRHLSVGLAAAEAAALAAQPVQAEAAPELAPEAARTELASALDAFDEPQAQSVLDALLARATLETVLSQVILPYLEDVGERWERGDVSIAQEHFATSVVRGRMLELARGWGRGIGPVALLACLPGERHELGLMAFGLALRRHGWRIVCLGSDTPLETVERAAEDLEPSLVVLSALAPERVEAVGTKLRELARGHRLALGGQVAEHADTAALGVLALTGDPISEAERVTALVRAGE